jgi:hypothetical protein
MSMKYWGNKILFVFISTLLVKCAFLGCFYEEVIVYIIQFVMISYSIWRIKRELDNHFKRIKIG